MPDKAKKYGSFEYGDIYEYDDSQPDCRGDYIGRLVIDQDSDEFYCKTKNRAARRLSRDQVAWMVAKDIIDFDHSDGRARLVDYMMKLDERKEKIRKARSEKYAREKAAEHLKKDEKLIKKTKTRSHVSRLLWACGCACLIGLGAFAAIPEPEAKPVIASIAGEGSVISIDPSLVSDSSYMVSMGNGSEDYGLVFDDEITESGQRNANESTVKENVLVNANVSGTYPIHLRPLYYDRSTFYQSQMKTDDANGGSIGVCLQNPSGYSLGVAANQLVVFGGRGMSSTVIADPGAYEANSASETANDIQERQNARSNGSSTSSNDSEEDHASSTMPEEWEGFDAADIDSSKIAASYWYTKNGSKKKADLRRRIAIVDVASALSSGNSDSDDDTSSGLEFIQMNYQDDDSSFYAPVISASPASNGSTYWIGYMKQAQNGSTGFYIRKYDDAEDVLLESYDNTLSTKDLTNEDYPITNYQLNGDRLFYEQQGWIWCLDLSKTEITVNGSQRTIKKENPMRICRASEIRPSVSKDEEFQASETGTTTVPISHYQVMSITTDKGVVTGIAFIEAESGSLVFQPINAATVASEDVNSGSGGNANTSNGVSSGDQTALDEANARNEANNASVSQDGEDSQDATSNGGEQEQDNDDVASTSDDSAQQDDNVESNGIVNDFLDGVTQSSYRVSLNKQMADNELTGNNENNATDKNNGSASVAGDDSDDADEIRRVAIRRGSDDHQITAFCVRGELFYWIEKDTSDDSKSVRVSPVFYKNNEQDASDSNDETDSSSSDSEIAMSAPDESYPNENADGSSTNVNELQQENGNNEQDNSDGTVDGESTDNASSSEPGDDQSDQADVSQDGEQG